MRQMDRLNRLIATTALFWVSFVFACPVSAVTYKWKDDKGGVYFTDDLNAIPLQYRSKPFVEIMEGLSEPPPSQKFDEGAASDAKEKNASTKVEPSKADKAKRAAEIKKLMEEKPHYQEAISHFENEIQRDERLTESIPPTMINGKYFVMGVEQLLPAKKALLEKLDKAELPALVATRGFLQSSVAQDEQEKVSEQTGVINQAAQVADRFKAELPALKQLVEQLKTEVVEVEQKLSVPATPAVGTEKSPGTASEPATIKEIEILEDETGGKTKTATPKG